MPECSHVTDTVDVTVCSSYDYYIHCVSEGFLLSAVSCGFSYSLGEFLVQVSHPRSAIGLHVSCASQRLLCFSVLRNEWISYRFRRLILCLTHLWVVAFFFFKLYSIFFCFHYRTFSGTWAYRMGIWSFSKLVSPKFQKLSVFVAGWPQMQVWILLGTLFMSTRSSFYRDWIWEKTVWFLIGQLTSVLLTTSVPGPLLFILYASVSSEESLRVTFDFISYCLFYVLMLLLRMLRLEK